MFNALVKKQYFYFNYFKGNCFLAQVVCVPFFQDTIENVFFFLSLIAFMFILFKSYEIPVRFKVNNSEFAKNAFLK